jgi:hypothetical protein
LNGTKEVCLLKFECTSLIVAPPENPVSFPPFLQMFRPDVACSGDAIPGDPGLYSSTQNSAPLHLRRLGRCDSGWPVGGRIISVGRLRDLDLVVFSLISILLSCRSKRGHRFTGTVGFKPS